MLAEEIIEKLSILPVEGLKIHEQTIEANVRALRETMLNHGRLVDPLVVDREHHVVLDGNHRREVLSQLKAENAVCQAVDYDDPSIRIGAWYLAVKSAPAGLLDHGENVDPAAGFEALQRMDATFMRMSQKGGSRQCTLIPSAGKNLSAVLREQEEAVSRLTNGHKVNGNGDSLVYVEDSRIDYFLQEGYTVFARRTFTKEEIIREAVAGRPLPPKSTRHLIPNRIIRLNFHLGHLNEPKEVSEQLLIDMVKKRVLYGSARYYTEPVIVMY
ncbi:MAG: hypothetical protein V1728_05610 [Candidatus Micrarchaeota archaeon]